MNEFQLKNSFEAILPDILARRRVPWATYRLQFNSNFTFRQAEELVPYLHDLGISDCYASPLLAACPGSEHGYDICDYSRLNPALGDEKDFAAFVAALHAHGMGLILDTVPNHMGISTPDNAWWMDVLENGPASPYAAYFDIDWHPIKSKLENKVLLPILEDQYGRVLESGKLEPGYESGAFFIGYYQARLPLAPRSYSAILSRCLDHLIEALGEDNEDLLEFQSILTALDHLPPRTVQEEAALEERNREKEVIKRRLARLTEANPPIQAAIESTVTSLKGQVGAPDSFDDLHALLETQPYRLAYWRVAAEEINYRRFFDINGLAAIRVELPQVFADTHALIFRWLAEGKVTGLRIDHPDGLQSPLDYFKQLQANYLLHQLQPRLEETGALPAEDELKQLITSWLETEPSRRECGNAGQNQDILDSASASFPAGDKRTPSSPDDGKNQGDLDSASQSTPAWPLYVVAEKILSDDEPLPQEWAIDGTTGYDFLNQVNGILVNRDNEQALDEVYRRFTTLTTRFEDLAAQTKEMIMRVSLASEINILAHQMENIIERNRRYRDFTLNSITAAIREVLTCLPIYRTYITPPQPPSDRDQQYIEAAVAEARRRNPRLPKSLLKFLGDTLLLRNLEDFVLEDRPGIIDFVLKFQQVSGPLTAKGLEDTAFYIYNRLASLNEVGGQPGQFGLPVDDFHQKNLDRLACWPHTMLATSTHDTKRSEDARARLNVLSEIPEAWQEALSRWSRLNAPHKTLIDGQPAPDRNDEYLFYQAVVGTWPFTGHDERESAARRGIGRPALSRLIQPGSAAFADFRQRILAYMKKATSEAKVHTSWINPNEAYDAAIDKFVSQALAGRQSSRFLSDLLAFTERVAYFGQFNSLTQLLLKLTSPGVPDLYQGTELWDFSLVDPDNRRPVDYERRRRLLAEVRQRVGGTGSQQRQILAQELLENSQDGKIKLYLTELTLAYRRDHPDLFFDGNYRPLEAVGSRQNHVVAFSRALKDKKILVIAPRLIVDLTEGVEWPPLGDVWSDTWLNLPGEPVNRRYADLFTGQVLSLQHINDTPGLPLADVFSYFPVALLISEPV